jgi:Mn-dependent DtxR family transcriptional regulator
MTGNSIRNSLERIDEYLRRRRDFVTITKISEDLHLHFTSVKKCLETLQRLGRVKIVSNGATTLVMFEGVKNG